MDELYVVPFILLNWWMAVYRAERKSVPYKTRAVSVDLAGVLNRVVEAWRMNTCRVDTGWTLVETVAFLPGWQTSRGATLEHHVEFNKEVVEHEAG